MGATITIKTQEYETLKRQAAAWREAVGNADRGAVFNEVRDNDGEGIEAGLLAKKLRSIINRDE